MIKRTLYFGNPAYLSLSSRQLVIRKSESQKEGAQGENICTRAIEDIGVIVIDHPQITLTSALIAALLDNNVALITCDSHHMPTGLLLPLSGNTIQSERFQAQVSASLPLKKQLWQQTVKQKIANQSTILRQLTSAEAGCMDKWSNDVRSGDIDNLEGRAAAYYWKNLFAQEIDHFKRGREEAAPNHLLNRAPAPLRAIMARALVSSGLLPTLGIHHHNRYNAYCLADDIMEPYRPYVDAHVLVLLRQKGFQEELTQEDKAYLLQIPTLDVCVEGKRSPLLVAASLTTASVAKCFTGELRKISYPKL